MAVHRYWRATRFEAYATGDLELSALQLIAGGVRVDAPATLSANTAPDVSGALANLQDTDLATAARWSAQAARRLAIDWDFGASPQDVATLRPAGNSHFRYPLFAQLQWSDDAVIWWTQETYVAMAWPGVGVLATLAVGAGDLFHSSVRSLLRFEGANNSVVFTDDTGTSTPTVIGAPTITTDQPLFGVSSGRFTAAGGYVDLGNVAALQPGAGQVYTVEAYVRLETLGVAHTILTNSLSAGTTGSNEAARFWVGVSNTNQISVRVNGELIQLGPALEAGVWFGVSVSVNPAASRYTVTTSSGTYPDQGWGGVIDRPLRYVGGQGVEPLRGWMAGLRITIGAARYTRAQDFLSLEEFRVQQSPLRNALRGAMRLAEPLAMLLGPVLPVYGLMALATPPVLRVQDGFADRVTGVLGTGRGRVRGTVKVTPDTPVSRRVRLIREVDGMVIREGTSDPVTGAYDFQFVDELQKWTVVSYDFENLFRAVIADNLTAELMP
jgi:hypothetical protein